MNSLLVRLPVLLALAPLPFATLLPAAPAPSASHPETANRHPVKGVVTDIRAEQSSLMVKHEAIPGVMRAMTMMFKVDAATLKAAQKGQAITGMLVRDGDTWWLREVKLGEIVAPAKKS